jgi:hypothetical protein
MDGSTGRDPFAPHDVGDRPAALADEVVMRLDDRVIARRSVGEAQHPHVLLRRQFLQVAVDRSEADGRHATAYTGMHLVGGGMIDRVADGGVHRPQLACATLFHAAAKSCASDSRTAPSMGAVAW